MRQKFTLLIAALFVASIYSACKKEVTPHKNQSVSSVSEAALGRQMATGLYQSFLAQFNSSNQKTNGLKTASASGCGVSVVTPASNTVVSGDTTRKFTGTSVYTPFCIIDPRYVDSYTLYDTLKTVETGPGFSNSYSSTHSFSVKGISGLLITTGTVTAANHLGKLNEQGITIEYHDIATQYKMDSLLIYPFATGNKFLLGQINFTTQTVDLDATTDRDGAFSGYSGYIYYFKNTARIYFKHPSSYGYVRYILNFDTGVMSGPVNSVGFPVDYSE